MRTIGGENIAQIIKNNVHWMQ